MKMNANKLVAPLLLVAGLAAFWQAGRLHRPLQELRESEGLSSSAPIEGMPPSMAFTTIALGGFRGVMADVLWMRSSDLQSEGRYFELVQLADWITKLEPNLPEVWAYQAWNMAYNIGGLFEAPEDRWRWVQNGIALLRDEGRVANPRSSRIYSELAFLFHHKIGGDSDPAHDYFQQQWMREMDAVLQNGSWPTLRTVYKIEPQKMEQLEKEVGPVDWRAPSTHSLYWLYEALPRASDLEQRSVRRMMAKGLMMAYFVGRIIYDPMQDRYLKRPNIHVALAVQREYERAMQLEPDDKSIRNAYFGFQAESVLNYCLVNRREEAAGFYQKFQRSVNGYQSVPMRVFALELYCRRSGLELRDCVSQLRAEAELMDRLDQTDLASGARWLAGD
jgi:hypothetical protein